ncbi:MAG TPA: Glu-tRNA(Gln) amidotransferase subunit GatE [Candidatus Nanoarchaeia archaeon]|nr:Glu-tRNA(Gln) amidotransferase subunit GatE [Candidatus Nanoarchaeia archaeon]
MAKIKCGLEIHQQLDCKKLFCECPSVIQENTPHFTIMRKLRAVVGETGEIDIAAAAEAMKGKKFIYEGYDDNCCLIELDEEPPRNLREEALLAAVQVAKLFKAKFVDEVQVMRKTVVDGSNTSGFQRSALVAYDGKIDSSLGKISIPTVIVEEDSARLIKDENDKTVFRLDRLGIPLLEVSTGPDIVSAEQCAEVAEKLGLFLRSTGKVKRGLGTIRQDVNVSIEGGERVEIKGAQDLKLLPKIVELEALRQENLLEIKRELAKRNVKSVVAQIVDVSRYLVNSKSKVIKSTLSNGGAVLGISLSCFKGLIGRELQPGKRLGTEFSDRAKVSAGVGGVFHSDELPNYGITPDEVELISKHLDCGSHDAFVLVADLKDKAERALQAVILRANDALRGVPKEVRRANPDATTTYMRPMPGAARMYPETDVLPVRITKKMIDSVELPELIEHKIGRYEKLGLGHDLAELVAKSDRTDLFDNFVKSFKELKPAYIAEILMTSERTIRRQFNVDISPTDEDYCDLFEALEHDEITKESVLEILKEKRPVKEVLPRFKLLSDSELERELKRIIEANQKLPFNALIGKAMSELRGKAAGQKIVELLKKLAK